MDINAQQLKLAEIFMPFAMKKYQQVTEGKCRFVHYTTAEAALSILSSKQIWMRNLTMMNDYSEFEYGLGCLNAALESQVGSDFNRILNQIAPSVYNDVVSNLNGWIPHFRDETYIACLSEHGSISSADEDRFGRLSMWRAYGGNAGVALVLSNGVMGNVPTEMGVYLSPVAYLDQGQFIDEFLRIVGNTKKHREFLTALDPEIIKATIILTFRAAMLSTKHPGFREEREWRIFHSPQYDGGVWPSAHTKIIRGVPQKVMTIDLVSDPSKGLIGVDLQSLVDRIIVGPHEHEDRIAKAFLAELHRIGIPEASHRVVISGIPLRG